MTKNRSKVKLSIVAVLTIIGLLLTFVSFLVPTTSTTFRGFFQAIDYGYDIGGGRLSVYKVNAEGFTEQEIDERLNETVMRFNNNFSNIGFNVTRQNDTVRIEISKNDNTDLSKLLSMTGSNVDLFDLIGSDKGITINTDSSKYDAEGSITSEYITGCKLGTSQAGQDGKSYYPITIEFSEQGKELLKEMTANLSKPENNNSTNQDGSNQEQKKLYLYLNGVNYNSQGFEMSGSGVTSLTLSSVNKEAAESLQLQVSALAKPIELTKIVDDMITSGLDTSTGAFFGNVEVLLLVALAILFVATVVFFCVKYRMLGLFATMAILIFVSIYTFLLQSIPLVLMDINGLLGALFTYGLLVAGMVEIFEKIRSEYALGKKIPNSVKSGFKKNLLKTLEKYVFLLIFTVVVYLVGSSALKALSASLFIGLFVNYFTIFVALRGMCMSYSVINGTHGKFYNLKREAVKNEF